MKRKILFANAKVEYKLNGKSIIVNCENVVFKEGSINLPNLMCKQCNIPNGKIISYEIIKELGYTTQIKGFTEVKKSEEKRNTKTGSYD